MSHSRFRARRSTSLAAVVFLVVGLLGAGTTAAQAADNAHITGKVTKAGGIGLAGIDVTVFQASEDEDGEVFWDEMGGTVTGTGGTYDVSALPAGSFRLGFTDYRNGDFAREYYDGAASVEDADTITVAAGATAAGKNAELGDAGHITGTVTKAGGTGLGAIYVIAYQEFAEDQDTYFAPVGYASTAADGTYDLGGLAAGTYRVGFEDFEGNEYQPEYFDDVADLYEAENIVIEAAATVSGKDAELAPGAHIKGKVTKPGGVGVADIDVNIYEKYTDDGYVDWDATGGTTTNADGTYDVGSLPPGTYRLGFEDYENELYLPEFFDNVAEVEEAEDITVADAESVAGKNAELQPGGHITGKVTKAGGTALSNIDVTVYEEFEDFGDTYWEEVGFTSTASNGTYNVAGLPTGVYRVGFEDGRENAAYASEYWNNKTTVEAASDVAVTAGSTTSGKNAELAAGGHIKGKITETSGAPLEDIVTVAYQQYGPPADNTWRFVGFAGTGADGNYDVNGLAAGTYRLSFAEFGNDVYVPEFFDNKSNVEAATNITVATGGTVTGKDATLEEGGSISGTVSFPSSPSEDASDGIVSVVDIASGEYVGYAETSPSEPGYTVSALAAGSYRVEFARAGGPSVAAAQFYDGVAESAGPDAADAVTVSLGEAKAGIDAALVTGGTIAGTVVDLNGDPVPGCLVAAYTANEHLAPREGQTDENGAFSVTGLSTGSYQLVVNPDDECAGVPRYYVGADGVLGGSESDATTIAATLGETTTLENDLVYKAAADVIDNTELPTVTGTPKVGETLTAENGTWTPSGVTFGYQWLADGAVISGATAKTYVPVTAVVGKKLSVKVTGSKSGSANVSKTSEETTAVAKPDVTNSTAPTVTGTAQVGKTLTANTGTWEPTGVAFGYQWLADGAVISGATAKTYVPVAAVVGKKLSVKVTGSKTGYSTTSTTSVETAEVAQPEVSSTAAAKVSGTAKVGQTLTASAGTWSPTGVSIVYQWLADGKEIDGATAKTYVPVTGDIGMKLSVTVAGSKTGYTGLKKTSPETAAIVAADVTPPGPITTPKHLRSTAQASSTLTLDWDAVAGAPGYRVQVSQSSKMTKPRYFSFDTDTGTVTGLASNTKFWFRVSVVNADNTARLTSYTPKPYPSARTEPYDLKAPGNLRSTSQGSTSLTLEWDADADAPKYRIQVSKNADMSSPKYVSFDTNTGTLTGLTPETKYYFRVALANADDSARLSQYSAKPAPSATTTVNGCGVVAGSTGKSC